MNTSPSKTIDLLAATAEQAARIAAGEPDETDDWAEGFPREDDHDAAEAAVNAPEDPAPFGMYLIVPLADGRIVGTAGFHGPPDENGRITIGYGMVESAWGRGYGTEAVAGLVEVCRRSGRVTAVDADTELDNIPSQRVLEKNGFTHVRDTEDARFFALALS